jgi:acetylornithine deacetylase
MTDTESLAARATEELARLVAFDTTSRGSNLELIQYAEEKLGALGARLKRVPNADGTKSNLWGMIGPDVEGGVVLSGHTDVVPVDGQPWTTDPWILTDKGDGRLYGRGTCDMKGFIALALAAAPELARAELSRPVHFAFSYDEEVGCLGAPSMIERIVEEGPRPSLVIVGEPTDMVAVSGHKGISTFRVTVTGHEAHSSLTHLGVSANMAAVKLMTCLDQIAERLIEEADPASPYLPKHPTLTIGRIDGGTAGNILARRCEFIFDLRAPGRFDRWAALKPFLELCETLDARMKAAWPGTGVSWELLGEVPALEPETDGPAEVFARRLAGDNGPARVVSYAAEAGQFQQAGFSVVICGPGSIDQAHQPDEYVEVAQMQRGGAFMARLVEALSSD